MAQPTDPSVVGTGTAQDGVVLPHRYKMAQDADPQMRSLSSWRLRKVMMVLERSIYNLLWSPILRCQVKGTRDDRRWSGAIWEASKWCAHIPCGVAWVSIFVRFETGSSFVSQAGLKLTIEHRLIYLPWSHEEAYCLGTPSGESYSMNIEGYFFKANLKVLEKLEMFNHSPNYTSVH